MEGLYSVTEPDEPRNSTIPDATPELYSIVIPAHNEEPVLEETVENLVEALTGAEIDYEIIIVVDHCTDGTETLATRLQADNNRLRIVHNTERPGFGMAVRKGLNSFSGSAVSIVMADGSDYPEDVVAYWREIEAGAECVFGSRFMKSSEVIDYPTHKYILNRITNWGIRILFCHSLNDTTNAFKCYRREVIDGCRPFLAPHFNLTVELPLKAVIRGYSYKVIPISWRNRKAGRSKLVIKEMGSRYLFIILYCLLERWIVSADYKRKPDGTLN
jgi:dolichol-phosphate mannosyltransferase